MTVEPTGEVHPVANLFPMLPDDELADLAADIKANGLLYPIVLDAEGTLIDGRNRLRACQMAGVEPAFTSLNGHDPVAYIIGANIERRHLSRGQAAMAHAMALELTGNLSLRDAATVRRVNRERLRIAVIVRQYAPELATAVMSGAMGLDVAYEEARIRKQASDSAEERGRAAAERLRELRRAAPDLADLVVEERMTLDEALAAAKERDRETERQRRTVTKNFLQALLYLDPSPSGIAATVRERVDRLDPSLVVGSDLAATGAADFSPRRIRNAAAVLSGIADALEE